MDYSKEVFDGLFKACEYVKPHLMEYVEYHQKRGGCSIEMEEALMRIDQAIQKAVCGSFNQCNGADGCDNENTSCS